MNMAEGGEKTNVVVIGGGIGGSLVAKTLQNEANVSLIDEKEYFEITWASLRSMVEPSFAKRSVISHSEYLPHAKIVASAAVDITDTDVLTTQGSRIRYDYLVVATGHTQRGASTKTEKISQYQAEYEKIKAGDSILIVGGGPTGVELAAEIAADFPAKKVTLVHRGSRLLEFIGESASKKALNWLTSKKVEVILGQSVDVNSASDGVYKTSGGETIVADCHFICIGTPFGSAWLRETILKDSLDSRGRLMVDSNLRIKGHNNIFAIGDITDIPELKQGYLAQEHAKIAAKNITLSIKGVEDDHKLAVYKPATKALAIVSLGRKEAVAQFPCLSIAGRVPGMIKSGDLFVGKTRKGLGLQPDV
ncbi:PREDICTED: apoptosis-inducing factor homolog B-like [Nicotiana attenuata]|uniref:External alternative nad(P)h-ubiquinone oxidoreductase b2, mitochondrial n=1 Tax=Nicotiana attenuata TaxID=49451 RepID=A0A314KHL6_NICAT|nr:PREDICTED: apoptosis-inducing factor homolog B-like [Nicotiana attenuata]OIT28793.1 external alternative nad(p)h-ubiquinone oxidoreductase b2, mitochondrial [Nicotiana attenuata]